MNDAQGSIYPMNAATRGSSEATVRIPKRFRWLPNLSVDALHMSINHSADWQVDLASIEMTRLEACHGLQVTMQSPFAFSRCVVGRPRRCLHVRSDRIRLRLPLLTRFFVSQPNA